MCTLSDPGTIQLSPESAHLLRGTPLEVQLRKRATPLMVKGKGEVLGKIRGHSVGDFFAGQANTGLTRTAWIQN